MKKYYSIISMLIITAAVLTGTGCSAVFTASVTGRLVDADDYEGDAPDPGIDEAEVYLYTKEGARDADLEEFTEDAPSRYFMKTVTVSSGGESGHFTFNGLIWSEMFPGYGKTGDRKEIFFLFYHPEYGTHTESAVVVSEVTNRTPPVKIPSLYNQGEIRGTVIDDETGDGVPGVTVRIYVPDSWEYGSDGEVLWEKEDGTLQTPVYGEEPDYTVTTDADGEYAREVTFLMMPDRETDRGTVPLLLSFDRNGYDADPVMEDDLENDLDLDGDGRITDAEIYYRTPLVSADEVTVMNDISLIPVEEEHQAELSGTVVNSNSSEGVGGVNVRIYVPREWDEDSSDYVYPEEPTYTVITGEGGDWNLDIAFPKLPDEENDTGTTSVIITFQRNQYIFDPSLDADLKEDRDMDGDGENDVYYRSPPIEDDTAVELPEISVRQTEFRESLEGRVFDNGGNPLNGRKVSLWLDSVSGDPDFVTYTSTRYIGTDNPTAQDGYFSFDSVRWTDETYTAPQSYVTVYIRINDSTIPADPVSGEIRVYSGGTNYAEVTLP
ncbi:MAG: hypothetical protein ACLFST_12300 [Spirochaetia bacterium]